CWATPLSTWSRPGTATGRRTTPSSPRSVTRWPPVEPCVTCPRRSWPRLTTTSPPSPERTCTSGAADHTPSGRSRPAEHVAAATRSPRETGGYGEAVSIVGHEGMALTQAQADVREVYHGGWIGP